MSASPYRHIGPGMDPNVVAAIDARLAGVRAEHGVHMPLAIESGSRAWGFPSPDSDYDCRFLYVRPAAAHLTPFPVRDVIETPLEGELDVNGWDLGKALRLLLKGNAVVIEWLQSPIAYGLDPVFRDDLLAFAGRFVDRDALADHYLHLGRRQQAVYLAAEQIALKKVFYALRPAFALRWLRLHPGGGLPPMDLPSIMAASDAGPALRAEVEALIAAKATTREMGHGAVPASILAFVEDEFARRASVERPYIPRDPSAAEAAQALYAATVTRLDREA